MSTQAPVFEYTYQGRRYEEQTAQNISYKQLIKKMREGETYPMYVDPKHPAVFIFQKKIKLKFYCYSVFWNSFFIWWYSYAF